MFFQIIGLVKIYTKRLEDLQMDISSRIHNTRLKEGIFSQFEDKKAFNKDREVYLTYDTAITEAVEIGQSWKLWRWGIHISSSCENCSTLYESQRTYKICWNI